MGSTTALDLIWTPDENDPAEPDVYLKTMAQSVEDGIGDRLRTQELAIGLKAGYTSAPTLSSTMAIANVTINTSNGSFKQGLDISGGVVTVVTPGMYMVSGGLGVTNIAGHTAEIQLRRGSTQLVVDSQKSDATFFQAAKCSTVVNCVAGDTLSMWVGDAAGGAAVASNLAMTHFTVAMVQAVPV
jgi:hypothetical protein